MPCRSDYMEPTARETYSRETASLIGYALDKLQRPLQNWIMKAANSIYGDAVNHDELTLLLCGLCMGMDEDEQARIIYNGRDASARRLADWWDNHQKVDAERKARDAAETERKRLAKQARAKLTPEERKALNL